MASHMEVCVRSFGYVYLAQKVGGGGGGGAKHAFENSVWIRPPCPCWFLRPCLKVKNDQKGGLVNGPLTAEAKNEQKVGLVK